MARAQGLLCESERRRGWLQQIALRVIDVVGDDESFNKITGELEKLDEVQGQYNAFLAGLAAPRPASSAPASGHGVPRTDLGDPDHGKVGDYRASSHHPASTPQAGPTKEGPVDPGQRDGREGRDRVRTAGKRASKRAGGSGSGRVGRAADHESPGEDNSVWEVVGGRDKCGIIVREGQDLFSKESGRLSTGALVRALEPPFAGRLRYELLNGTGPQSGWVSLSASGKSLLVLVSDKMGQRCGQGPHEVPENAANQDIPGGLQTYRQRFKNVERRALPFYNRKAFAWRTKHGSAEKQPLQNEDDVHAELERDIGFKLGSEEVPPADRDAASSNSDYDEEFVPASLSNLQEWQWDEWAFRETQAEDSDSEQVWLCAQCSLPLGDVLYAVGDSRKRPRMHGECMAQWMLNEMRKEDQRRRDEEASSKRSRREEFDIGWRIARIPSNAGVAEKMDCNFSPKGMCGLVEASCGRVCVVPTLEPAASVNLEYLSIALKVRRQEGREPLFSLDPVDPACKCDAMQVKRYVPEWLAGTCVGDVLFQADYYLKELSMGEYEQPVVGMRSCFDFSWDEGRENHWRGREWFLVRKAEVHLSQDNVLIPYVRVGVEAWEQIVGNDGQLQDAKVNRSNHPLRRYAEAFTHNFELIAERKSVIFHLRELAKVSVLAKYLVDACVLVPEAWFNAVDMPVSAVPVESLQLPQLWNERNCGKIRVQDGTIIEDEQGFGRTHGVYGGVDFGLGRFSIGKSAATTMLDITLASGHALVRGKEAFFTRRPSQLAGQAGHSAVRRVVGEPRGVDLNLSDFDVSTPTRVATQVPAVQVDDHTCAAIGRDFWVNIDNQNGSVFTDEDRMLLKNLFHPRLSDRREEANQFVPPDPSIAHIERLSRLLKEEDEVRSRRMQNFLSSQFAAKDPGPLFPSSWKKYIEIERAQITRECSLHERPDYKAKAHMFDHVLRSAIPVFDESTEEGNRFRVYKVGSIEVRTTQEPNAKEIVGAVFSKRPSTQTSMEAKQSCTVKDSHELTKVTVFVEKDPRLPSYYRYYLSFETEDGNAIVTEMLLDGSVAWRENPADLEDRNSLAKAFHSKDCRGKGVTVEDMKSYHRKATERATSTALQSTGKRYAQCLFDSASDAAEGLQYVD